MKTIIHLSIILSCVLILNTGCEKDSSSTPTATNTNTNPPWNGLSSFKTYIKLDSGIWTDLAIAFPEETDKITISVTGSSANTVAVYRWSYHNWSNSASNPDRTYYFKTIKYTEDLSNSSEKIGTIEFANSTNISGVTFKFDIYNLTPAEISTLSSLGTKIKLTEDFKIYYCTISGSLEGYITLATLPILTTSIVTSITSTTASCIGNLKNTAGIDNTVRGVCWSTSPNPTIANSKTTDGYGIGTFTSTITNLSANTIYYVRAYATNTKGTGYGNEVSFSTQNGLVNLTTTSISSITATTASSGGNITSDGGASVTSRGVCWSTTPNPTIANSKTIDGSGIGSFTSSLNGLNGNTTYYVRAYATNSVSTSYGNQISFTTNPAVLATLSTSDAILQTFASATSGGNIANDGGSAITTRGICWSTTTNPTILNNKTTDGSGTGSFSSSITGLIPNTTYYIRAYATNSVGTSYGNQVGLTVGIGGRYQGGIIAYILQVGDPGYIAGQIHGLIAAPNDQGIIQWFNGSNTSTGATETALGTGITNTNKIVANQGTGGYAARLCYDLVLSGYSDWYLPSKDELNKLYLNRTAIGGFTSSYYWSSSEYDNSHARVQSFNAAGVQTHTIKSTTFYVRAIRNF